MSNSKLTDEQQIVVNSQSNSIAVNAYAGTGKTHTLIAYSNQYLDEKILYLAYNSSMREEAKVKFGSNVECHTVHSLAFQHEGRKYKDKLLSSGDYRVAELSSYLISYRDIDLPNNVVEVSYDILKSWLNSAYNSIEDYTTDYIAKNTRKSNYFANRKKEEKEQIISYSKLIWDDMCDIENKRLKMPHDGYLKLFQLSQSKIKKYQRVLLDEAQDSNSVTVDIFTNKIDAEYKVMVGDIYQAIYQFRGSVNALSDFQEESESIYLTQSFRFGENIAELASKTLKTFRRESKQLIGLNKHSDHIEIIESLPEFLKLNRTFEESIVLISRGNGVLFRTAFDYMDKNLIPYFSGGIKRYELDLIRALTEISKHGKIVTNKYLKDYDYLKKFDDINEIKQYAETVEELDLLSFCILVEQYGSDKVNAYIDQIMSYEQQNDIEDKNDITLVTAHRSKGLEYTNVIIANDFMGLSEFISEVNSNKNPSMKLIDYQAETNLFYVAITRAKENLFIEKSDIYDFIVANDKPKIPERYFEKIHASKYELSIDQKLANFSKSGLETFVTHISKMSSEEIFNDSDAYLEAILTVSNNIINVPKLKEVLAPESKEALKLSDELYYSIFDSVSTGKQVDTEIKLAFWNILWLVDCLEFYKLLFSVLPKGASNKIELKKISENENMLNKYKGLVKQYLDKSADFEYLSPNGNFIKGCSYIPTRENTGLSGDDYSKYTSLFSNNEKTIKNANTDKYIESNTTISNPKDQTKINSENDYFFNLAIAGDLDAQLYVANRYLKGTNEVPRDYEKAIFWYQKAAKSGLHEAQNDLGDIYYNGNGVEQSYYKAFEWYQKAANQGNADAQRKLGSMYYNGNGVARDYAKTIEWYTKAANQGNADAQKMLGDLYSDCETIAGALGYHYYNAKYVDESEAKALELYTKAANNGNADAQEVLGNIYYNEGNYAKAIEWYTKAANQGNSGAQEMLGNIHYDNEDYAKAIEWYTKAANQGCYMAQKKLGDIYYNGNGVEQDYAKAAEWRHKADNTPIFN